MGNKILTINLGTTSSRLSLWEDKSQIAEASLYHPDEKLQSLTQRQHVEERKGLIRDWLNENKTEIEELCAVAIRAATLPKEPSGGTFQVEGMLRADLEALYEPDAQLRHGRTIILPLLNELLKGNDIPVFVVDPANQNDMIPEARLSGQPHIERDTAFHALNQKMVARIEAAKRGKRYEDCNFVIAHMGGGVSVGAHQHGKVTDVNNCIGQEGPFSPTRVGYLPARKLIDYIFKNDLTHQQAIKLLTGDAGIKGYLGTTDMREVEKRIQEGDEMAALVHDSFAYKVAKEIGGLCAVIREEVDAIILTGGISNSELMVSKIRAYVEKFAPVLVYKGDYENEALAGGVQRVLEGKETLMKYPQ